MSHELCMRCARPVVRISVDRHVLRSCSYCEMRIWESGGRYEHRDEVLEDLGARVAEGALGS